MKLSATISVSRRPRTDNEAELVNVITNNAMQMGLKDFDQAVKDLKGAGIVVGEDQMTLEASKVKITNNGTTAALFTDGKISADYINVKTLDAKAIVTDGLSANTIDANKATLKNLNVNNCVVRGSIRSPFVSAGDSYTSVYSDNISPGVLGPFEKSSCKVAIPWDISCSGRKVVITGGVLINAPTGYYFYEDGKKLSCLRTVCEVVELVGFGLDSTFYGWIVLNRRNLTSQYSYGRDMRPLAYGRVTFGASSVNLDSYRTWDDSTLSVSLDEEKGAVIKFPSTWCSSADAVLPMVTCLGVSGIDNPYVLGVTDVAQSYIRVARNPGVTSSVRFTFMIYNAYSWMNYNHS